MAEQADETIVIRYITDAKDILEKSKQIRAQVDGIKVEMKKMAADGKAGFSEIARAMIEVSQVKMTGEITRLQAELKALSVTTKENKNATEEEKRAFIEGASNKIQRINEVKAAIASERTTHQQYAASVRQGLREINQESKTATSGIVSFIKSFAGIAGALVGVTSLVGVLQKITAALSEATKYAYEFAKATFSMAVGVRAIQRAGVDITLQEAYQQLERLRSSFGIFSRKELVEGSAAFYNLNRDMGFTKEQLFTLQNAIATLAVVNGAAMDEVQRTVALAISSGYTEGLQRLGVSINRVTIAEEAMRLGFEGGYTALSEQERAEATYNETINKTNIYLDDLLRYQKSLPGQIDTATASITDQTTALGENTLGWKLWFTELKLGFVETASYLAGMLNIKAQMEFIAGFQQQQAERMGRELTPEELTQYKDIASKLWSRGMMYGKYSIPELFQKYEIPSETWNPFEDTESLQTASDEVKAIVDEHLDEILELQDEYEENSKDAMDDYLLDMEELRIDHARRNEEIERDHNRRVEELRIDHLRRLEDLQIEHTRRIDDINTDYERALLDLEAGLANDVASVWADYYNKLASAEASYRNKQIDAEIKYQETLLRLREGFLLDLEDALQNRDARQVLKLIRRYNLEKEQADRAFAQEMDRLRRQHEERLAELARQRDERLRQLYAEIEAKRAALELEHLRKLEDEKRRFEREQMDEEARFQQSRDDETRRFLQRMGDEVRRFIIAQKDRLNKYRLEMEDLRTHLNDRYNTIADALADEVTLTDENMELVRQALNDTLGPGGEADAIYTEFARIATEKMAAAGQAAVNAATAAATAIAYLNALQTLQAGMPGPIAPTYVTPQHLPEGYAEGGVTYANKPTTALYGEAGPELAAFIPLNDTVAATKALSALGSAAGVPAGGGSVSIEILLDRYLEGRIVDTAVDNVADVVLRRFRQ